MSIIISVSHDNLLIVLSFTFLVHSNQKEQESQLF